MTDLEQDDKTPTPPRRRTTSIPSIPSIPSIGGSNAIGSSSIGAMRIGSEEDDQPIADVQASGSEQAFPRQPAACRQRVFVE